MKQNKKDRAITLVDLENLGLHFARIRKSMGLTQPEACKITNISLPTMVNLEKGRSPFTSDYIKRFETAYAISVKIAIAMNADDFNRLQTV